MVIQVIDINRFAVLKSKGNTPVSRHRYGMMTFKLTAHFMQLEPRQVHTSWSAASIKSS